MALGEAPRRGRRRPCSPPWCGAFGVLERTGNPARDVIVLTDGQQPTRPDEAKRRGPCFASLQRPRISRLPPRVWALALGAGSLPTPQMAWFGPLGTDPRAGHAWAPRGPGGDHADQPRRPRPLVPHGRAVRRRPPRHQALPRYRRPIPAGGRRSTVLPRRSRSAGRSRARRPARGGRRRPARRRRIDGPDHGDKRAAGPAGEWQARPRTL